MDSESTWNKNYAFNNGTYEVSKNKRKKSRLSKNIPEVEDLEILDITKKLIDIDSKKKQYSKSIIFDDDTHKDNPYAYIKKNESTVEGFDLIRDNSGNFQIIQDNITDDINTFGNSYSDLMNLTAHNAGIAAANTSHITNQIGTTAINNLNIIGNTIAADANYSLDYVKNITINTDLNIVNMISNIIEPKDFADKELEEDLKKNQIFTVPKDPSSTCKKTFDQPYKPPAPPDYNAIFYDKYINNELTNVVSIPGESPPPPPEPKTTSDIATMEAKNIEDVAVGLFDIIYYNPISQFIIQNMRIIEYPFIYWKWFVKKIGILWCNLMYTTITIFYKGKYQAPTDDEKRLVIANMNSLLCFLFSVLITYNWFFLMFYNFHGERINTYTYSSESLKKISGLLNFVLEFVLYPLECLDWFMLKKIPTWILYIFNKNINIVFIITYALVSMVTLSSVGPSIIDLLYDSLKLLFNKKLKPWQPVMTHTYNSFWKSIWNFFDKSKKSIGNNLTVSYSVTLSTYVFLHIMMFYAQLSDALPSYFKKSDATQGGSENSLGSTLQNVGSGIASAAEGIGSGIASAAQGMGQAAASAAQGMGQVASSTAQGMGNALGSVGTLGANEIKNKDDPSQHVDNKKPSTPEQHPVQTPITKPSPRPNKIKKRGGALKMPSMPKLSENSMEKIGNVGKGVAGAAGAIGSFASKINPFSGASGLLSNIPGSSVLSSLGSVLSSGSFMGALFSFFMFLIRFGITQYFVNLAAFFIALYLLWYSFFGIFWFSKLSLFDTIKEIEEFISRFSIRYIYEKCVSNECKKNTIWEMFLRIIYGIIDNTFPVLFYITVLIIMFNSCYEYSDLNIGIKSSPQLKYGLIGSNIAIISIVLLRMYTTFVKKYSLTKTT